MIFSLEMARLLRQGKKTQTRHIVKGDCRYVPGRCYAVQVGRKTVAHITITDVREEPLGAITLQDARKEGFRTRDEFFRYYDEHGLVYLGQQVHVISFELGDTTDRDRFLAARAGAPHGDYVSSSMLKLNGTGPEVSPHEQAKWQRQADQAHVERLSDARKRGLEAIREVQMHAPTGKARKELRWAEKRFEAVAEDILTKAVSSA